MILLDTCTLLWLTSDQTKLSPEAKTLIKNNNGNLFVSAISAFEISIKNRKGKIKLSLNALEWFEQSLAFHGILEIPVSSKIAIQATELPTLHQDPCDRIIVATAQIESCLILTPDSLIHKYPDIRCVW